MLANMSVIEHDGPKGIREILFSEFKRVIWAIYHTEVGKTSSESFSSRFAEVLEGAQKSLLVVDQPLLSKYRLLAAAVRGVKVEVAMNSDEPTTDFVTDLEGKGIKVHLVDPKVFRKIGDRFIVSDGKDVLTVAIGNGEYTFVKDSMFLGEALTRDFANLTGGK